MNQHPVLLEYFKLQFFLTYTKESIIDLYGIEIFILQKAFYFTKFEYFKISQNKSNSI